MNRYENSRTIVNKPMIYLFKFMFYALITLIFGFIFFYLQYATNTGQFWITFFGVTTGLGCWETAKAFINFIRNLG